MQRMRRIWLRWAANLIQSESKITTGNPADEQHSTYLLDCDVFLTADKRYVDALQLREPSEPQPRAVEIDADVEKEVNLLKELTWIYVIRNPALAAQQHGQKQLITSLFNIFRGAASESEPRSSQVNTAGTPLSKFAPPSMNPTRVNSFTQPSLVSSSSRPAVDRSASKHRHSHFCSIRPMDAGGLQVSTGTKIQSAFREANIAATARGDLGSRSATLSPREQPAAPLGQAPGERFDRLGARAQ